MTSSNQDIAYLVPKTLWERVQEELKQHKGGLNLMNYAQNNKDQSGGALTAVGTQGQVDPGALMKMLAVQMNLNQSPRANFVSHADQLMKQILHDPRLSDEEKIRYLNSAKDAFRTQRVAAVQPMQTPRPTMRAPPQVPPSSTPSHSGSQVPQGIPSTPTTSTPQRTRVTINADSQRKIKMMKKKIKEIQMSPRLSPEDKARVTKTLRTEMKRLRSGRAF